MLDGFKQDLLGLLVCHFIIAFGQADLQCKAVMRIRLNYYTDPDPGSGNPPYKSGSKENTSHKINFFKILWKKCTYLLSLTDIEQQLYKNWLRSQEDS